MIEVLLYGFAGLVLEMEVKRGTLSDQELEVGGWGLGFHSGVRLLHQTSTCLQSNNFGAPCGLDFGTSLPNFEGPKPAYSTEWLGVCQSLTCFLWRGGSHLTCPCGTGVPRS